MYNLQKTTRVRLGDVFSRLDDKFQVLDSEIQFPYLVVLSQDCDLQQDYDARLKNPVVHNAVIDTILVAPAFADEQVRMGVHLKDAMLQMDQMGSKERTKWKMIADNKNPRYHYLKQDESTELPALVIDFKRFFTLPRNKLYDNYDGHFTASINELYRELMSQRFAFYFSRIGLPDESPES